MVKFCDILKLKKIQLETLLLILICFISCSQEDYSAIIEGIDSSNYIIAHRGNWQDTSFPENSRAAIKSALLLDIYGVEFDVRQTKDGILVLNHDSVYYDLVISNSTYSDLLQKKLSNGETIPTLTEIIDIYKSINRKVKLIIHIKQCNIDDIINLFNKSGILDKVEFISSSEYYCNSLVSKGNNYNVFYIADIEESSYEPYLITEKKYAGFSYSDKLLRNHRNWISEAQSLGLCVSVWTVDNVYEIKSYVDQNIKVITNSIYLFQKK